MLPACCNLASVLLLIQRSLVLFKPRMYSCCRRSDRHPHPPASTACRAQDYDPSVKRTPFCPPSCARASCGWKHLHTVQGGVGSHEQHLLLCQDVGGACDKRPTPLCTCTTSALPCRHPWRRGVWGSVATHIDRDQNVKQNQGWKVVAFIVSDSRSKTNAVYHLSVESGILVGTHSGEGRGIPVRDVL